MRTTRFFLCLFCGIFLLTTSLTAQTPNFNETWKEFLYNNKISNMSGLAKPDKKYELPNYAKYLLMKTNTNFCQSEVDKAEDMLAEIRDIEPIVYQSIEGYMAKLDDLEKKVRAYHRIDEVWLRFLQTKEVDPDDLQAIKEDKTLCEKETLAKYSYMSAYYNLCRGDIKQARNIFENRTLRLAEKTTLRVADVEGLEEEVSRMKSFFQDLSKLDRTWSRFMETGESEGYLDDFPMFKCYPVPNMKILVLNGWTDVCNDGPAALAEIKKLQAESGASDRELDKKVSELKAAVGEKNEDVAVLNKAWAAFLPANEVKYLGKYGYEYCENEPLIKAYIMDGFAFVCGSGQEMIDKIDALQRKQYTELDDVTIGKINELAELIEEYKNNTSVIQKRWQQFVAQGDMLDDDYPSTENYCDNIDQVKDWTINGLSGSCEDGIAYLERIEAFQSTFEFSFAEDLECRVQRLKIKIWECRHVTLVELAKLESETDDYQDRLAELMEEYGMEGRPDDCLSN